MKSLKKNEWTDKLWKISRLKNFSISFLPIVLGLFGFIIIVNQKNGG